MDRVAVLKFYKTGHSLAECAERFECSKQAIHQMIRRHAPQLMRPPHTWKPKLTPGADRH